MKKRIFKNWAHEKKKLDRKRKIKELCEHFEVGFNHEIFGELYVNEIKLSTDSQDDERKRIAKTLGLI